MSNNTDEQNDEATFEVEKNSQVGTRYTIGLEGGLIVQFTAPKGTSFEAQEKLAGIVFEFLEENCGTEAAATAFAGLKAKLQEMLAAQG